MLFINKKYAKLKNVFGINPAKFRAYHNLVS